MAADVEIKKTTNLDTSLHGLIRFSNYSMRVLAFTQTGEGVQSHPIYCATEEDGKFHLCICVIFPSLRRLSVIAVGILILLETTE